MSDILTNEIKAKIEDRLLSDDPEDIVAALSATIFELGWNGDPSDSEVVGMVKQRKTLDLIHAAEDGIEDGTIIPRATATVTGTTAREDETTLYGMEAPDEDELEAFRKKYPKGVTEPKDTRKDDKGFDADADSDIDAYT